MLPWNALKDYPEVTCYNSRSESQPLFILKYIRACLDESNLPMTSVIGGDGLDKKSRISRETVLLSWHKAVPQLVQAWEGGTFRDELLKLPFFQTGPLTQKELYCCFAGSKRFPSLRAFGLKHMVCGDGARKGARTFLANHLPCHNDNVCLHIQRLVSKYVAPVVESVSVADIETSLCACTVYIRHVRELKTKSIEHLSVFAGFRPCERDGSFVSGTVPVLPSFSRKDLKIGQLPSRWRTRILRKRPAAAGSTATQRRPTPVFLEVQRLAGNRQERAPRGSHSSSRSSTAKGRVRWSAKYPNQCHACKKWLGARCRFHCGRPVLKCAGKIDRRR